MKFSLRKIAMILAIAVACNASALRLPEIINSNMMLQQSTDALLWGWAKPGSRVTVTTGWNHKSYSAKAGANGRWDVKVATTEASYTPQTITIHGDGKTMKLDNVLIGEVWFASGQSNMEMPLRGFWGAPVEGANKAIAESGKYRKAIRFATVPKVNALTPQDSVKGGWVECVPENAPAFSAVGYFFARQLNDIIDVPVGIINCSWGGSKVEGWLPAEILKGYQDIDLANASDPNYQEYSKPMIMYNGMLHPLIGYTVRGFLWNQGESNVGAHKTYPERFATMVNLWRESWNQPEAPFYAVEIPPYNYGDESGSWGAMLREAQHKAVKIIKNGGIVPTCDLIVPGTSYQIHPTKKREIGERLAYLAATRDYGVKGVVGEAPEFESMEVKGDTALLHFVNADDGFSPERDIYGFEVAGDDHVFYPAEAHEVYSNRCDIQVTSASVPEIKAVRYGFKNWQPTYLYNMRGLPLVPFRTDDWEN
jgi:sialate O-acetylesterase